MRAGVAGSSPLEGVELAEIVTEIRGLAKLELRGEVAAFTPAPGEQLLPINPARALVVSQGSARALHERIAPLGYRVYDMSGALTALEFSGAVLLSRLTELEPGQLPASGPVARGVAALVEARGGERFRLYVPRAFARYVAEVVVDLARGLTL